MRRYLLGIGAILLLAGCASEKPSFHEAVYDLALPYAYATNEQEAFYIDLVCNLEAEGIHQEYEIVALQAVSAVNNAEATSNYIDLVTDYHC